MKEFNLWDIAELVCTKEEKDKLLSLNDTEYNNIDDRFIELSSKLKSAIYEELGLEDEK